MHGNGFENKPAEAMPNPMVPLNEPDQPEKPCDPVCSPLNAHAKPLMQRCRSLDVDARTALPKEKRSGSFLENAAPSVAPKSTRRRAWFGEPTIPIGCVDGKSSSREQHHRKVLRGISASPFIFFFCGHWHLFGMAHFIIWVFSLLMCFLSWSGYVASAGFTGTHNPDEQVWIGDKDFLKGIPSEEGVLRISTSWFLFWVCGHVICMAWGIFLIWIFFFSIFFFRLYVN
jgi:hypothetical protein